MGSNQKLLEPAKGVFLLLFKRDVCLDGFEGIQQSGTGCHQR